MLYLRARYYAPKMGRFLTSDTWGGNFYEPSSLNKWIYVGNSPTNYVDPMGLWRWGLSSSIFHDLIENQYEGTALGLANPIKQLEYRIPSTTPKNTWHKIDMFNSITGAVYEIEPWTLAYSTSPNHGAQQALRYVLELDSVKNRLVGNHNGIPYNWSLAPFHLGTGLDWPGKYRTVMPGFPALDLVADYVKPGVISFWLEANGFVPVPAWNPYRKYVKPENWNPRQALQPAYVLSWQAGCGEVLVVVGGAIIAVTIVEDAATFGIGTFDDVITIPGGLLFINIGQRLAVQVIP